MKKILAALMGMTLALPVFAQIQIESSSQAKSFKEYRKEACAIAWEEDGYYFRIADYECSKAQIQGEKYIIRVYLGKTVEEVRQSAKTLHDWFRKADNEDFLYTVNPNGDKVCLYKYNANLYASYGTEVNCKATRISYGTDMAIVIMGGNYQATSAYDRETLVNNLAFGEHTLTGACSFKKDFLKSVKNFKG